MFRRDPVPAQSAVPSTFKHVHGAIYLCGEGMRPGEQPHHHLGSKDDMGDHTPSAYLGAVTINCERQAARERAAGAHSSQGSHLYAVTVFKLARVRFP